ncbi:MAG: NAD(P)H-dependent flavin oxidoreductase [Bdellovibrio sp.]
MKTLKSRIATRFSLKIPLIVAPMAGGPTTPELVAASCEAGALGALAAPYLKPSDIELMTARVRSLTDKPFAINLFAPTPEITISLEQKQKALDSTRQFRQELGLPDPTIAEPYSENFKDQMEMVLKLKPEIFIYSLGYVPEEFILACHQQGIYVIGTATTLAEALMLQKHGVDAITLQGQEAGGHRSIANALDRDPGISTLNLLSQCRQNIDLPLIAAGGLMNGADIARALQLGADATQLGTAFLLCPEAGTSEVYRHELRKAHGNQTHLTRVYSGRLARGISNRFMREMEKHPEAILPFPAQNAFTRDLRKSSAEKGIPDFASLWAGTEVHRIQELPAKKLIAQLMSQLNESL